MATAIAVNANSVQGQISQLSNAFAAVERSGSTFETHQGRSTDLLHNALEQVFAFGEALLAAPSPPGVSLVREFFADKGIPYNARTQANAYIGLVKLVFPSTSESSRSQYATVLQFAGQQKIPSSAFKAWLTSKGIEGWRSEAVKAQASRLYQVKNQGRLSRLQQATTTLLSRPLSATVALPAGVQAPQGFALVLAAIDGANNASIIDIVESDQQSIEPVLLKLVKTSQPQSQEALSGLFRAIDLIVSTTPDKISGEPRDLLIRNTAGGGAPITIVEAISEAYSFPGASMILAGHVGELPQGEAFHLPASDAKHLLQQVDRFANWTLDASGKITADSLAQPIQLHQITDAGTYRIAIAPPDNGKPLTISQAQFDDVVVWIENQRADHARKNKTRKEPAPFPASISLAIVGSNLTMRLPTSALTAVFAETGADGGLDDRTFAVDDIERITATMSRYQTDAAGWIIDTDVDDAGVVLEAHFDNDSFRMILPTRTGSDYNQVCQGLVL